MTQLPEADPFRGKHEASLLGKLYELHIVDSTAKVSDVDAKVTVSAFCRRRLAVVMCKLRMAQTVKMVRRGTTGELTAQATQYVEQGHVRVGPDTITDPAFLVNRCVALRRDRAHLQQSRGLCHLGRLVQDQAHSRSLCVDSASLRLTSADNDELDDYDLA